MKQYSTFLFITIFCAKTLIAQIYNTLPIKEEYDLYNTYEVNESKPCTIDPNNDSGIFGDGMSKLLEGYITMYKTTGDKAYLYKFIIQSLCMMKNRHDYSGINSQPRWAWDNRMHRDGYIIAAFSRFVYFIKLEEPSLFNAPIYQFPEIKSNTNCECCCNSFNITFNTFGDYANWLQDRVGETLWWFLTNGYWDNSMGFKQLPDDDVATIINMQIGFGRALLFNGLTANNSDFINKANIIANLFKGNVYFYDPCESKSFYIVLRLTSDNSYWWYHRGWQINTQNCWIWDWDALELHYYPNVPDYYDYTEFIEDISHGAIVTWLPLDFYYFFQPSTPFI